MFCTCILVAVDEEKLRETSSGTRRWLVRSYQEKLNDVKRKEGPLPITKSFRKSGKNLQHRLLETVSHRTLQFIIIIIITTTTTTTTTSSSRSQWPRGLKHRSAAARLLRSWVRIPRGHGCVSVVSVVCCQVEVSATSWSLVQRSPTDCGASCVI